jgi:hypothetical protein
VDLLKSGISLADQVKKSREKEEKLKVLNNNAHYVWSVGQMMFEHFNVQTVTGKHREIILPLNPLFSPNPSGRSPLAGSSTFRVLFVGRCEDQYVKGLDIAAAACVRAAELLKQCISPTKKVQLVIRGIPADDVVSIMRTAARSANIIYKGFGTPADVKQDLWDNHLFIMPSRCEPSGLVCNSCAGVGQQWSSRYVEEDR